MHQPCFCAHTRAQSISHNNGLPGHVIDELWGLPELQVLDLSGNMLTGPLPERVGIEVSTPVDVSEDAVAAGRRCVSTTVRQSIELRTLNLRHNRLTGTSVCCG